MTSIAIIGGGLCGNLTAALLAGDGHDVTVVERDPAKVATTPDEAWQDWERRGVPQFRLGHVFLSRFGHELSVHLPGIRQALVDEGMLESSLLGEGANQPGDERFVVLTGRRPVVESVIARETAAIPGVQVRRGVAVESLVVADGNRVVGVELSDGSNVSAEVVVDASGRRSSVPRMLAEAGCRAPVEEIDDCGFVYYGRSFRSDDGSIPVLLGPGLQHYNSVSTLTLPADHGHWFVAFVVSSDDKGFRKSTDPELYERLWRSYPLVAHWHDGIPDSDVKIMAGIEDRIRHYVVDGEPVATGLVAVGDAWACTNPSVGRGASVGLLHAIALRDHLREESPADPTQFALAWNQRTEQTVRPWFDDTVSAERQRLAEVRHQLGLDRSEATGAFAVGHNDPTIQHYRDLPSVMLGHPRLFRAFLENFMMLRTREEIFSSPDIQAALAAAKAEAGDRVQPSPGLDRSAVEALLNGNSV